jgi:hypothetical protein
MKELVKLEEEILKTPDDAFGRASFSREKRWVL